MTANQPTRTDVIIALKNLCERTVPNLRSYETAESMLPVYRRVSTALLRALDLYETDNVKAVAFTGQLMVMYPDYFV